MCISDTDVYLFWQSDGTERGIRVNVICIIGFESNVMNNFERSAVSLLLNTFRKTGSN